MQRLRARQLGLAGVQAERRRPLTSIATGIAIGITTAAGNISGLTVTVAATIIISKTEGRRAI
jgi:hypothetical protein